MGRQVANDGGEEADDDDGDDEAGPAVQVVCGRDASEQDLPEDGEEVHDVVKTGRQPLLASVLFILIFRPGRDMDKDREDRRGEENVFKLVL